MFENYKERIDRAKNKQHEIFDKFKEGDYVYPLWFRNPIAYGTVVKVDKVARVVMVDFNGSIKQFMPDDLIKLNPDFAKKARKASKNRRKYDFE